MTAHHLTRYLLVLLILLAVNLSIGGRNAGGVSASSVSLGLSFPPVADVEKRDFTAVHMNSLNLYHLRFDENWSLREPMVDGGYNWAPLDNKLVWTETQNLSLLLTIQSNGPAWACDTGVRNDQSCVFTDVGKIRFEEYVNTLFQRYPNKIAKVQFGNEWLAKYWFIGTAEDFIEYSNIIYIAIQAHSPSTKMVLGGIQTAAMRQLAYCNNTIDSFYDDKGVLYNAVQREAFCSSAMFVEGKQRLLDVLAGAHYDYLDIHLYDDVENWPLYIETIRGMVYKERPILVSEFGGPNLIWERPYSDTLQAERLKEYLQTLSKIPITEAYYFKLIQTDSAHVSHLESGLFKLAGDEVFKKPAYDVFVSFMENTFTVAISAWLNVLLDNK